MRRRLLPAALLLLSGVPSVAQETAPAVPVTIPVIADPIVDFEVGSDATRFGAFEFVGGLELTSTSSDLGGMSAIRVLEDGEGFIGIMDTGRWFSGRLQRDEAGRLAGLADFTVTPMRDVGGVEQSEKWMVDAEGMAIREGRILVSFERDERVETYSLTDFPTGLPTGSLDVLIPAREFRGNRGLETVAVSPMESPLEGAVVIVSERSLDDEGHILAAVLHGPRKGVFTVRRDPPFDVTDGTFLPDGDLLLLERRFNISGGLGMRIRRIAAGDILPGATVDGEVLLEADFGDQIDNMEGIDVIEAGDGGLSVVLVSDDNHSILQRNLILEFRLVDPVSATGAPVPAE